MNYEEIIEALDFCSHRDDGSCIGCPSPDRCCGAEEAILLIESLIFQRSKIL